MKKIIFSIIISILSINNFSSQTIPQGMKYQAVARDASGIEIANKSISLKMSLHSALSNSKIYYSETHNITTNEFGLCSLSIGEGNVQFGKFDKIPWAEENIWMEIAIKEEEDNYYTTLSNTKLLAVPYAYHANTANRINDKGNSNNGNGVQAGVPSQNWSLFGNSKTNPEKDKLGTTDVADFVFVTDNKERMRLLSSGELEVRENAQFDKSINVDNITKTDYLVVADEANDTIPDIYPRDGSIVDVRGLFIADSIAIKGGLDIGGNLSVHGDRVEIDKDLYVGRNVHLNTSDQFSPQGQTINYGEFTSKGQVTIITETPLTGGDGDYDAYPLRVEGSEQGIAIKVNGRRSNSNNFVTFWDDNGRQGRIEGQRLTELEDSWPYRHEKSMLALEGILSGLEGIACSPNELEAAFHLARELEYAYRLTKYKNENKDRIGVTYESGSGDYAEWLEKVNSNETFNYGDIVGVKGGKISKKSLNASKFMVVSKSPIVLGNMPVQGKESNYEKIAFMGQVPVKVRGKVEVGDYIIASNLNDGIGIAINPKAITFDQFERIVGVAWSEAYGKSSLLMVNCAVGINTNDLVLKLKQQNKELYQLKSQMNNILTYLKSKDESFEVELFKIEDKETIKANINIENDNHYQFDRNKLVEKFIKENPDYIKQIQANARKILEERGVDYNLYEETKRLLTDETYFMNLLQKLKE